MEEIGLVTLTPGPCLTKRNLTLSHALQPMAVQLSKKSVLPLAKILATASCRSRKTGPSPLKPAAIPQ